MVLGFLDVFGHWSLQWLFPLAAAVVTTAIGYRVVLRRARLAVRSVQAGHAAAYDGASSSLAGAKRAESNSG